MAAPAFSPTRMALDLPQARAEAALAVSVAWVANSDDHDSWARLSCDRTWFWAASNPDTALDSAGCAAGWFVVETLEVCGIPVMASGGRVLTCASALPASPARA